MSTTLLPPQPPHPPSIEEETLVGECEETPEAQPLGVLNSAAANDEPSEGGEEQEQNGEHSRQEEFGESNDTRNGSHVNLLQLLPEERGGARASMRGRRMREWFSSMDSSRKCYSEFGK